MCAQLLIVFNQPTRKSPHSVSELCHGTIRLKSPSNAQMSQRYGSNGQLDDAVNVRHDRGTCT